MEPLDIKKWHTEEPLFALVLLISTGLWILLCISIIGILYAAFIGVFFFLAHLAFIAHIRGNAVKLGPNQFPELYNRIHELSDRINLNKVPDAYIMQAGGALNALATKLFASNIIILYSDLLDACEDNESARDMIIGHELGHVKAGHLNLVWFLFPGLIFPFIGQALSRAREYTCDQYGAVLSGDKNGALLGLAILAAGAQKGPQVNLTELINQKKDYTSGFLTIGKWLSTHPPLCDRISVLAPELNQVKTNTSKGNVRAFTILLVATLLPIILSAVAIIKIIPTFKKAMAERQVNEEQAESTFPVIIDEKMAIQSVHSDFKILAKLVEEVKLKTGALPSDENYSLSAAWSLFRSGKEEPKDPFDGKNYGYQIDGENYFLWSVGVDRKNSTEDDIVYHSSQN